jgi:hypothetical protein
MIDRVHHRTRTLAPYCAAALGGALALSSCRRVEDAAAKARIFSPEEPQGSVPSAAERLDAQKLADDPTLAARVLHMPRSEIAARLGAYKAQTRVQFAWFRGPAAPDGGTEVQLAEESSIAQAAGPDFSARLSNDHNGGFEIVWRNGEIFERGLFGPYRKRRTDRTSPERLREQALAALPTFDRLARGLRLKAAGEARVDGRRALKYLVAGTGARPRRDEDPDLPPLQYPERAQATEREKDQGPDPDTARRLELFEKEEPISASGFVLVDAQTGVPLACDLQGRFRVGGSGKEAAAELHLHAVLGTSDVGKDPKLKAPAYEPDPSVPHAVKDPLRFLGRAAQPGAPADESTTEDDEAEAEAAPQR